MIGYFDTSAIVKLFIEEPGSTTAAATWHASDVRLCCTVGYTETAAALARAARIGRIDVDVVDGLVDVLDDVWQRVTSFAVDERLARAAAAYALRLELRGYDAVHLAAAAEAGATLITADVALLASARAVGLETVDVNA